MFEQLPHDEREALARIRNKTCVPSLLWQRIAAAAPDGDSEPLLLRRAVIARLQPALDLLQTRGYFQQVRINAEPGKPGWAQLTLQGVSPRFLLLH
ncbi:hypothetical protein [Magnetofaba australis]|uniref:Uncharacterized protein n=1 Tax=Magnetofaba australis IT-1 TaxID=1434232 RepID=A0A1Y2K0R6_9PROT|nr:hypothetical protein [Magnetofaba australis]OSM01562.1 hypothetical protein MAIT1_01558 [Magnetofaba australis IT-1]